MVGINAFSFWKGLKLARDCKDDTGYQKLLSKCKSAEDKHIKTRNKKQTL